MDDRTEIASRVMQGILSFSNELDWVSNVDPGLKPTTENLARQVAIVSVIFADALLEHLKT